jgi:16S rRNA G966 N2-methylase RsmD
VAVDAIKANLHATGLAGPAATVVLSSVDRWLAGAGGGRLDRVFADPPYAFTAWPELLGSLDAGVAVLESNKVVALEEPWRVLKVKHYGGTVVTVATRRSTRP